MAVKEVQISVGGRLLVELPHLNKRLLIRVGQDGLQICSDKCPHRGGPIHLAYKDRKGVWRCPWHGRAIVKPRAVSDVSGTYEACAKTLRLITEESGHGPWPVKIIPVRNLETDDIAADQNEVLPVSGSFQEQRGKEQEVSNEQKRP